MATYDSAWLLAELKRVVGRPATDEALADADYYTKLTIAQDQVIGRLAPMVPHVFYGSSPTQLTSSDGNKTFTFGTDKNGYPIVPIGHFRLYRALGDFPHTYLLPGDEFVVEGGNIRSVNNVALSGGAPWAWFCAPPPNDIAAGGSAEPDPRVPGHWRMLYVYEAARKIAMEGGFMDPSPFDRQYAELAGEFLRAMRTQAAGMGAQGGRDFRWWRHTPAGYYGLGGRG